MTAPALARRRLADGAANLGIALEDQHLDRFEAFAALLEEGRSRLNLTTITGPEDVADKLFLDSLTAMLGLPAPLAAGERIIDIGTGAGFPGVPLAVMMPEAGVTLLDATARKAAWVDGAVRAAGIANAWGVAGRAEDLGHDPGWRGQFGVATARAIASLAAIAEMAIPLLRPGGIAIALKTATGVDDEIASAERALDLVGGMVSRVVVIPEDVLPNRAVVTMVRTGDVPPGYPRRPGVPARWPLGSGTEREPRRR